MTKMKNNRRAVAIVGGIVVVSASLCLGTLYQASTLVNSNLTVNIRHSSVEKVTAASNQNQSGSVDKLTDVNASSTSNTNGVTDSKKPVDVGGTTAATGTILNSHSNITPTDSVAYVVANSGNAEAIRPVSTDPQSQSSKSDTVIQPEGLTFSQAEAWQSKAKQEAIINYIKTGRKQNIIQLSTVATIQIGSNAIPSASAIDVSSYQSWMNQANFNKLKQLGVRAVTVKTTEGTTYANPYAANQISMARAAGMTVSMYHFARFDTAASARAEADYAATVMSRLGMSKSTIIFADMEASGTINNPGVHGNLTSFFNELSAKGFSNHGLYTSSGYSSLNTMVSTVGKSKTWIAQYPYTPSSSNMQHSDYGAWQFSSTAQIPGNYNYLDVSHDYNGLLVGSTNSGNTSSSTSAKPKDTEISYNKYVTVTSTVPGTVWTNFSWVAKTSVADYYHKTFLAKTIYYNSNGQTYLGLYFKDGVFEGYINAGYTTVAGNAGGSAIVTNKLITVTKSNNDRVLSNFSGATGEAVSNLIGHSYLAKYTYFNINGVAYYSLYSTAGVWAGYVPVSDCAGSDGTGNAITYGKYVTVTSKTSGALWSNFSWAKKEDLSKYYHKTFLAKQVYYNANGQTYYSVYDNNGTWKGYLNAGYTTTGKGAEGAVVGSNSYVTITSSIKGSLWGSFSWDKRSSTESHLNQTYHVKAIYYHINGQTYYSLFNDDGSWAGYVNAGYVTFGGGQEGAGIAYNKYVKITSTVPGTIWSSFNWTPKYSVSSKLHSKYYAKWMYHHINGQKYYSLYDNGAWVGYINAGYTTTTK